MMEINRDDNYKIFTMNDEGNLLVGHLEVKDVKNLTILRDFLLKSKKYNFKRTERHGSCANGVYIPKIEVINNYLVRRDNFFVDYIKTLKPDDNESRYMLIARFDDDTMASLIIYRSSEVQNG